MTELVHNIIENVYQQRVLRVVMVGDLCAVMKRSTCQQFFKAINEINILRYVSHPNVVPILCFDLCKDLLSDFKVAMFVQDLQCNLYDWIRSPSYNVFLVDKFARQIVETVLFLHSKLVVHLDLKPENILISLKGTDICLSDFEGSRMLKTSEDSTVSFSHYSNGTVYWNAPESFIRSENGGFNVFLFAMDTFQVGLVLRTLFVRMLPWKDQQNPCYLHPEAFSSETEETEWQKLFNTHPDIPSAINEAIHGLHAYNILNRWTLNAFHEAFWDQTPQFPELESNPLHKIYCLTQYGMDAIDHLTSLLKDTSEDSTLYTIWILCSVETPQWFHPRKFPEFIQQLIANSMNFLSTKTLLVYFLFYTRNTDEILFNPHVVDFLAHMIENRDAMFMNSDPVNRLLLILNAIYKEKKTS